MSKFNIQLDPRTTSPSLVFATIVGILLAAVTIFAFQAWIVMLVMGALHAEVASSIPAISYWASALVVFALGILGSFFRRSN